MKTNLKLFWSLIIVPIVLAFANASLSSYKRFRWGYDHINQISMTLFFISGAVSLFFVFAKGNSLKLRIAAGTFLVISMTLFYITYSFSNFGF